MDTNTKLRVGGVPEHFNLPWHLASENGHFEKKEIDFEWITFPGGTGQMCKALRDNEVDICVILTEGIVADIIKGSPTKIIGQYINSPLIWGVHTGADNELDNYDNIFDKRYAISRFGSGSHLMAIVDAHSKGKQLKKEQFVPIKNLEGAEKSLVSLETDVFYWEKFMTKPFVDAGKFRRIGEYLTPWPSFVIAARTDVIDKHQSSVNDLLNIIRFNCDQFMRAPYSIGEVATKYRLRPEDVEVWFHLTEWSCDNFISKKMLENVMFALKNAGLIEGITPVSQLIHEL